MVAKGHTSIGTSTEEQELELEAFYDFSESYKEINFAHLKKKTVAALMGNEAVDDEDTWDDDDEDEEDEELADLIGRQAAHRSIAYVYKQRIGKKRNDPVRLALLHAKQLKALTENGESALEKERLSRLSRRHHQQQSQAQMDRIQRFDLRVGSKANKLNRTMKTAEKYFI
ncbi:uncharacterized protein LOC129618347 [Condylostylus longicornis]|uniref:uncharacterized protein LOC129618347 n=1 Tax=Condylostylus longicornis TaxID=2530218 RepID=UPI00244DB888|nr:uncharacterized protein LOC129618347 [Condylostylus longicornis]